MIRAAVAPHAKSAVNQSRMEFASDVKRKQKSVFVRRSNSRNRAELLCFYAQPYFFHSINYLVVYTG